MGFDKFTIQISFFPNERDTDSCLREVIGFGDFTGSRQSCSKLKIKDTKLEHIPTIQVAAALAGVLTATEIILYIKGESRLKNKVLQYAADYHRLLEIEVPQSIYCYRHEYVNYIKHETRLTSKQTYRDILQELKIEFDSDFYIRWGEEYIYSIECEGCKKEILIKRFKSEVYDEERWCDSCLGKGLYDIDTPVNSKWEIISELNLFNPNHNFYLDMKLEEFGIKVNDIIIAFDLYSNLNKILVLIN